MDINVMGLLGHLNELSEAGMLTKEEAELSLTKFYEDFIGQFRPVIEATPLLAEKIAKDITPVLIAFYAMSKKIKSSKKLEKIILENKKLLAVHKMNILKIYIDEGFTRPEAMVLLMQDISRSHTSVTDLTKQIEIAKKK